MTGDLIIIRASSLTGYPDCPRRGATRIARKIIEAAGYQLRDTPRGIGAAIGSAVHGAVALVLGEKAKTGGLPPDTVATDCAADQVREAAADGVMYDGVRGATRNLNEAMHQATGMARAYHRVIAPTVHPILVEERLEAEVSPGLVLSGQSDLVAREPNQIRDLKTSTRVGGNHNPQIGAYSLLARTPTPERPEGIDIECASIDTIQRVATKKPQPDPVSHPVPLAIAETAASNIIRHIAEDLRVFRDGDMQRRLLPGDPWAFLANPNSMLCSAKWCGAFGTEFCREHAPAKQENE